MSGPGNPYGDGVTTPLRVPEPPKPRKRGKVVLITVVALLVVALGAAGVVFGPRIASALHVPGAAPETQAPPSPVQPQYAVKGVATSAPEPSTQGLASALAGPVSNGALGSVSGTVIDPTSGKTLWEKSPTTQLTPASTGKLLATSAALLSLDPQSTLDTTVVAGPQPGSVVLVGGGDPTLSALGAGKKSIYPAAAHLDDLVSQVKKATGSQVSKVYLDVGRYVDDGLGPGWLPGDVAAGFQAKPVPIMLDGARADPTVSEGAAARRSEQPAVDTAKEFARRLGVDLTSNPVQLGTRAQGAKTLAKVSSPPIYQLVETCLQISDNVLAENLAREVALKAGKPGSFAGGVAAVREVLANNGIEVSGTQMMDGSGLSPQDKVTAKALASLLAVAAGNDSSDGQGAGRAAKLRPLLAGLPVGGGSGTLSDRYRSGAALAGRGWVRAKTGTLDGVNNLAGVVTDNDGRLLVFTLISNGSGDSKTIRTALDAVATTIRGCGCH